MEDSTPFCTLCGISLPLSSKRTTMSTSVEAPLSFHKPALFLTWALSNYYCDWSFHMPDSYVTGSSGMSYCNQTPLPCEGWGLGTRLYLTQYTHFAAGYMLSTLSNRWHQIATGHCINYRRGFYMDTCSHLVKYIPLISACLLLSSRFVSSTLNKAHSKCVFGC